jgi:hypothetical protein
MALAMALPMRAPVLVTTLVVNVEALNPWSIVSTS